MSILDSSVNRARGSPLALGISTVRHETRKLLYVVALCTWGLDGFIVCGRCRSGIRAYRNPIERKTQQRPGEEMQEEPRRRPNRASSRNGQGSATYLRDTKGRRVRVDVRLTLR